jgi:hypothetical protein
MVWPRNGEPLRVNRTLQDDLTLADGYEYTGLRGPVAPWESVGVDDQWLAVAFLVGLSCLGWRGSRQRGGQRHGVASRGQEDWQYAHEVMVMDRPEITNRCGPRHTCRFTVLARLGYTRPGSGMNRSRNKVG